MLRGLRMLSAKSSRGNGPAPQAADHPAPLATTRRLRNASINRRRGGLIDKLIVTVSAICFYLFPADTAGCLAAIGWIRLGRCIEHALLIAFNLHSNC